MLEGQRVASWVWDQLAADTGAGGVSTLTGARIFRDRVPQAAALPAVTVTLVSATDANTFNAYRAFANALLDVRVVGEGSTYQNVIADRIDTVLQRASGTKSGAVIVRLRREQVTAFLEDDAGRSYSHIVTSWRTESYAA